MAATGHAKWTGDIKSGSGTVETGTKALDATYSAASRYGDGTGTSPEELIAAAHASCFTMALTLIMGMGGLKPESVETDASVYLRRTETGFEIHKIELSTVGTVPGLSDEDFQAHAITAKEHCPVSKALTGPEITLEAKLAD
jgi:osmotically inducible protein OsmC